MKKPEIMVSICCITYNHEKYIGEALDSFLMQQTNFNFEILIGEDCSSDDTRKIIEDYCQKYPDIVHLLTDKVNVGGIKNQLRTLNRSKGKYIAMCDGDDYWIDPFKLQKQVDFLENNPDSLICCHYSRVIDENDELVYEDPSPVKLEFSYQDVLLGKKKETRICTLMMRNDSHIKQISSQNWYYQTHGTDTFLKLFVLAREDGKIHVLPEVMAVYRLHRNGVWSMIDAKVRKRKMISDFNIMINNFHYSNAYRKKLLKIYVMQYFLFDIRNFNIHKAINTIMRLV